MAEKEKDNGKKEGERGERVEKETYLNTPSRVTAEGTCKLPKNL